MATFREKFQEFLLDQGVQSIYSTAATDEHEIRMKAQGSMLSQNQKQEAEQIADVFFNEADKIVFADGRFPKVLAENMIGVKHTDTSASVGVTMYARSLIAYRLGRMNIGNDYDVEAVYVSTHIATREGDSEISHRVQPGEAVDDYRITVKMGLF